VKCCCLVAVGVEKRVDKRPLTHSPKVDHSYVGRIGTRPDNKSTSQAYNYRSGDYRNIITIYAIISSDHRQEKFVKRSFELRTFALH